MKLRVTRAASAFVLAATLLAGCGEPANQSSFVPGAVQAAQAAGSAVQAGRSAAQSAAASARKGTAESGADSLSSWPQAGRLLESARSAAAPSKSVADWWRSVFNKVSGNPQGLAGGGKVFAVQPQPR